MKAGRWVVLQLKSPLQLSRSEKHMLQQAYLELNWLGKGVTNPLEDEGGQNAQPHLSNCGGETSC